MHAGVSCRPSYYHTGGVNSSIQLTFRVVGNPATGSHLGYLDFKTAHTSLTDTSLRSDMLLCDHQPLAELSYNELVIYKNSGFEYR
jgi:hypothetical protein